VLDGTVFQVNKAYGSILVRNGEEAEPYVTWMKVRSKVTGQYFQQAHIIKVPSILSGVTIDPSILTYCTMLAEVTIYPIKFAGLFWLVLKSIFALFKFKLFHNNKC
jgi:hypothetical protein